MKYSSLFTVFVVLGFLFSRCSPSNEVNPKADEFDYDRESVKIMEELAPQLVGSWKLQQVHIDYQRYNLRPNKLQLNKDTVFYEFATLDIYPAARSRFSPKQPRHPEFEGSIHFRGKTYPVYFYLLANAERVVSKTGPAAFFLFNYNFPIGMHIPEPEELFLEDLGLIWDNFSLEMRTDQSTMIWKGLNRGIEKIELRKQ